MAITTALLPTRLLNQEATALKASGRLDDPAIVRRARLGQHTSVCVIQRAAHDHMLDCLVTPPGHGSNTALLQSIF